MKLDALQNAQECEYKSVLINKAMLNIVYSISSLRGTFHVFVGEK